MTLPCDIGAELVRLRRASGVSQRELGMRIGATQPQVARWEANAYASARLERVQAVARVLGCISAEAEDGTSRGAENAAEATAEYLASSRASATDAVRDLGGVAARLRAQSDVLCGFGLKAVSVFGSFADGTQTPASDVDLLVEFGRPVGFEYMRAAASLEEILGRRVDMIRSPLLKPRLRERVLAEAVRVWDA